VATVAELAFVAQWALLMHEAGAVRAAFRVVAVIAVAEGLSWLAVLTRNDFFHAAENACGRSRRRSRPRSSPRAGARGPARRNVIVAAIVSAVAYIVFMAAYVVPMYMPLARGRHLSQGGPGAAPGARRNTVEHDWAQWRQDAAWLTPYFTICVWMSIALAFVPSLRS